MIKNPFRNSLRSIVVVAAALTGWLQSPVAVAVPFTSDLSVSSTLTFDTAFADPASAGASFYAISGSGTQTGVLRGAAGGVALSGSSYNGFTVTGSNPLTAVLTNTGDYIGAHSNVASATDSGTFAAGIGSPIDLTQLSLSVHNNSATIGYRLLFSYAMQNTVTATGPDAFAHSQFSLSANGTELRFSDLTSDSKNGNVKNGVAGGLGGTVVQSDIATLAFDLLPGGDLNLHGFWTLEGGAFATGSAASSLFDLTLSIFRVTPLDQPPPSVPVPGTLVLLGLGLLALARVRQKSH